MTGQPTTPTLFPDTPHSEAGRRRLRWPGAAHPPPVLLRPDGQVEVLDGDLPDLLLGVDPSVQRHDRVAVLPAGSTVFLHTDGLVERRDRDLDTGTGALVSVLRSEERRVGKEGRSRWSPYH